MDRLLQTWENEKRACTPLPKSIAMIHSQAVARLIWMNSQHSRK